MATDPLIVLDEYLAPIAGENPAGRNLAYEPVYDELREARRIEDDTLQGDWQRKAKVADWERVIDLAASALRKESKDLQIAAWMTEALVRRHGFAGLRDGLELVRNINDRFWETYYPEIDDGDLESRYGPFVFLDTTLPSLIRSLPLTGGLSGESYSYFRWRESRSTDNTGLKNQELMEALIAEGKITSKQFDDAVAQTPRRFYEELADDIRQCAEAYKALDAGLDERFGRQAPGLVNIRKALDDCRTVLEPILKTKREQEPLPEDAPSEEEAPPVDETAADAWVEDEAPSQAPRRRPAAVRSSAGPIASVADAHQRIVEAAAYLRANDPSSPVPYVVVRALRVGELHGAGNPPDPAQCEAPASEVRVSLRRLASEGDWDALLEQAEQALSRPEGRAWLDAHRFALAAMAGSSTDRSAAAAACKSVLRACLAEFPDLPSAELNDGTPTANAETRAWLRDEITPPAQASAHGSEPADNVPPSPPLAAPVAPAPGDAVAEPDPWTVAVELAGSGRMAQAIELIRRAMTAASTGRERFLRKLQLAELCVSANRHHVALPLSEDLARQVDEFHLEEWESEQLCARVWASFYRCLRSGAAGNGTAERVQEVFARLCRLDVNQALTFGGDGSRH